MYIDPFVAGILTTVFAELVIVFMMAIFSSKGE